MLVSDPRGNSIVHQLRRLLEVVAVDLANGTSVEDVFSLKGVNLSTWVTAIDGYSRFDK